jgi:hypothetical protein
MIRNRSEEVRQNLDNFQDHFRDMIADGHRQALQKRLQYFSGSRVDQLRALSWSVIDTSSPVILGDSVVFVELVDGQFKPCSEQGDELYIVWLPISSSRVLAGAAVAQFSVDTQRINRGAACCSFDSFCANVGPERFQSLIPSIRSSILRLDKEAEDSICRESLNRLLTK